MSDDLSMKALDGPLNMRAKHALLAGCDLVLHCNGDMVEMVEIASEVKPLDGVHARRAEAALSHLVVPEAFDRAAAEARLAALLKDAA
jgi:beta-N-acetylhexosaminidase